MAHHPPVRIGDRPPNGGVSASINRLGHCTVVVDPHTRWAAAVVDAVNALRRDGRPITEATLAGVINAPAPCDPDLAIVLGPDTELPLALVWELAYCELVYVGTTWGEL